MANNRITWQNVAAPSFTDALRGTSAAGEMLASGLTGIGGGLGAIDQRQRDASSNAAMAEALKYTDPAAWAEMLKTQGLGGGLGMDPTRMNADAMQFFQDRRTSLLGNQSTAASTANTEAGTQRTLGLMAGDAASTASTIAGTQQTIQDIANEKANAANQAVLNERATTTWDQGQATIAATAEVKKEDARVKAAIAGISGVQLAKMVNGGGVYASLGITPQSVSPEVNALIAGLPQQVQSDALAARNLVDENAIYNTAKQTAATTGRADQFAMSGKNDGLTRDRMVQKVTALNLSTEDQKIYLAAIDKLPDANFAVPQEISNSVSAMPIVSSSANRLEIAQADANFGLSPEAQSLVTMQAAMAKSGATDPYAALLATTQSTVNPNDPTEVSAYQDSAGQFMENAKALETEFPGLDKRVIAQVMSDSIGRDSTLGITAFHDGTGTSMTNARKTLSGMATAEKRNTTQEEIVNQQARIKKISTLKGTLDTTQMEYEQQIFTAKNPADRSRIDSLFATKFFKLNAAITDALDTPEQKKMAAQAKDQGQANTLQSMRGRGSQPPAAASAGSAPPPQAARSYWSMPQPSDWPSFQLGNGTTP